MLLLCLLILITNSVFTEQLNYESLVKQSCLYNIYANNVKDDVFVYYSKQFNQHEYLDIMKINFSRLNFGIDDKINNINYFGKYHYFIFLIETILEMNNLFLKLSKFDIWNSRAKYMLVFNKNVDVKEVFQISWNYYVYNTAVIINEIIYVYYPYKNGLCGETITPEILMSCHEATIETIFPEKIPFDMQGCKIKLLALNMPPLVIDEFTNNKNDPKEAGIEVTILHLVAERLNFTEVYFKNPFDEWGTRYENGTYTAMYAMILRKEVDIMFGFLYANRRLDVAFDSTFPHIVDIADWWVPIALPISDWKNLTRIFTLSLWIAVVVITFTHGIFWWIIGRKIETSIYYNNLVLSILNSWLILLQNIFGFPKSYVLRITVIIWSISSLIIFTASTSQLISYLTNPLYEEQIDSVEKFVNTDLKRGLFPAIARIFDPKYPIEAKLLENYVSCTLELECEHRTATERDMVVFSNRRTMLYLMMKRWTFPNGRKMLYEINEHEIRACLRYNMNKGFPLLDRINFVVMGLQENGLITKLDDEIKYTDREIKDIDEKSLSLHHVQAAFYFLLIGYIISILTFCVELILYKMQKNKI